MGTALTLRNICYETDLHTTLHQRDILPVLLLPLMGNDRFEDEIMEHLPIDCQYLEESKTREPDAQVRKALVQALSLLCYTEYGWNYLKDHSVYHVCRELHLWETDPSTKEAIETLVGFLLVENYSGLDPGNNEDSLVVPSVTEIVKDIPDFILTM
ncbi:protein HGH1 homolog [Caerostris extrusa]|uniref:Protein HGH1 homolog n=1 Tax=Caerostris extrusa TaxID=172846 RepID=A0AAV4SR88_CAEEX|nr:protein HGH1 homolog [Caerostris extrusa]